MYELQSLPPHRAWSVALILAGLVDTASDVVSHHGCNWHFPNARASFPVLICHLSIFFCKVFKSFPFFKIVLLIFLMLSLGVLYIFKIQVFHQIHALQNSLPDCDLFVLLLPVSFEKFLILRKSNLSICSFMDHPFGVISKKPLSSQCHNYL